jgi:branched-chain amino acid transport system permease protein
MVYLACLRSPYTPGEDGLQGVPRGTLLGVLDLSNDLVMYYVVLAIAIGGFALIVRTVHSPFGQVLGAIKENEPRAISLGYDVDKYKLLAFVLSAALAGLAGATKTLVLGFETLTDVHWSMSGLVILMTLVGGMGTLVGPIIGAFIIVALENKLGDLGGFLANASGIEWFSTLGESVGIVTGLIFVACVLLFRRGIVGEIGALLAAAARRKTA